MQPPRLLSDRAFDRIVQRTLNRTGLERILVVRAMERGKGGSLPRPTDAVWRWADGSEEPVLLLDFQNDDRRVLRDIVAAGGGMQTRAYLAPFEPFKAAEGSKGLPAVAITPRRVLVGELEAVYPGGSVEPHLLSPPEL